MQGSEPHWLTLTPADAVREIVSSVAGFAVAGGYSQ